MKYIDDFLNRITMYRVVLYGLSILSMVSILFGFTDLLPYGGFSQITTLGILLVVCFVTNYFFSKIYKAPTNSESNFITAFILFFIITPELVPKTLGFLVISAILAIASKYILAIGKKHIFNPAAFALFALPFFGSGDAIWWVGSAVLLPFTLVFGFLVLRKIQRFSLFFAFFGVTVVTMSIGAFVQGTSVLEVLVQAVVSGPIIFLGTIMLTEPLTAPPTRKLQMIYGALVGLCYGSYFHIGNISASPEFALLIGNIFSYIVSPREKLFLKLKEKKLVAVNTYEFIFSNDREFSFIPGQYFEWTLAHTNPDTRGNRRYFTIASSPTEKDVRIGIRTTDVNPSSFKKALVAMEEGEVVVAGSRSGDFVLPTDTTQKLVFISGGIGVTPFRSMIVYMLDTGEHRDIVHFYSNKTYGDIAYADIFARAKEVGVKTVYTLTDTQTLPPEWKGEAGFVDIAMIQKYVTDLPERIFYISGPRSMVVIFEKTLAGAGVKKSNIKTDFFPGFA